MYYVYLRLEIAQVLAKWFLVNLLVDETDLLLKTD